MFLSEAEAIVWADLCSNVMRSIVYPLNNGKRGHAIYDTGRERISSEFPEWEDFYS